MKTFLSFLTMIFISQGSLAQAMSEAQITKMMKEVNEAEIDAAKLANRKAQNEQVKVYAEKMIQEHKKSEKEIKKVAKSAKIGMDRSEEMKQMKLDAKKNLSILKDTEASQFDKAYMTSQLQMHQQVLDNINNKFLPAATSPELKAYLEQTKAYIENHLNEARNIQSTLQ